MKQLYQFDETFDSQKTFRIILEAMSNPFRELSVREMAEKMYGEYPELLAVALTLLDNEVSYHVCGDKELSEQIKLLTHAEQTSLSEADYLFVTDFSKLQSAVEGAKSGTLEDPQRSATILVADNGLKEIQGTFFGPGIKEIANVMITDTMSQAVRIRDEQEYEYPQGIDYIFVTGEGMLTCIPRLVMRKE